MPRPIELIVNSAAAPEVQCCYVQVNADMIRNEMLNGRPHIVLPSYTLPDNVVMNGGLYTHDEIEANYKQLEGTLAPLGHPMVDGKHVSANTPEALHANHVGAFNRNVQRRGNRVYVEKWIDTEFAANSAKGRELLAAIEKREPIHTSVACWQSRELAPNAEGYQWVARISKVDHDAILLGEPGAATPAQGVGLMVNVADSVILAPNAGVLADDSFNARQNALHLAAQKRYGNDSWVQDFDTATAIVRMDGGEVKAIAYTMAAGVAAFADESQPVHREESWVVNQIDRICQFLKLKVDSETSKPDSPNTPPEAVDMDAKELAEALAANAKAINDGLAEALKPLSERLDNLEANQKTAAEALQANAEAQAKPKRDAVAKVIGELAANKLSGPELDEAFSKLQTAAPLALGMDTNADAAPKGVPGDEYFN